MPKYLLAYHGTPQFDSPEDGKQHMEKWREWSQGLGEAVIDPGSPLGKSITVSKDGIANDGGSNPLAGTTTVEAETIEAAADMAKSCPHVLAGGSIEVAQIMSMDM